MEKLERDYMRELLNIMNSNNNNDEPQPLELIYHKIYGTKETKFPKSKSKYHN